MGMSDTKAKFENKVEKLDTKTKETRLVNIDDIS